MLNTNSTLFRPVSLMTKFAIFGKCAKKKLHNFCKTLYRRCLRGLWIYLRSWIYQGSEYGSSSRYIRGLHIPGFWIWLWFWICQSSEYARVLNIPGLRKLLNVPEYPWIISEYAWLSLNMPEGAWIYQHWSEYG